MIGLIPYHNGWVFKDGSVDLIDMKTADGWTQQMVDDLADVLEKAESIGFAAGKESDDDEAHKEGYSEGRIDCLDEFAAHGMKLPEGTKK